MELPDFDSPVAIRELLERNGFAARKRFGQNFLVSRGMRERIIRLADLREGGEAWEIGPGIGSMTALALETGALIRGFEIDRGFVSILAAAFGGSAEGHLTIVAGDVMKTWRGEREKTGTPERVFGNLPYNVASALIADFIESGMLPERMCFTVQKEVGLRMAAKPGGTDYSSFSVLCSSAYSVKCEAEVKRGSFWPIPRVDSVVVTMTRREPPLRPEDSASFFLLVRALFSSRRKTVRNNLRAMPALSRLGQEDLSAALAAAGVDPDLRGETLSPERIAALAASLGPFLSGNRPN